MKSFPWKDTRQIMGLREIYVISNKKYINLLSCQNLSYNIELYYINKKIFNDKYVMKILKI